jgi:hypothetical protein
VNEHVRHEDSVDQAIVRVLNAERTARAAVERCRDEARREAAHARIRERQVLERADRRIEAVRERCSAALSEHLHRLSTELERICLNPTVDAATRERLAKVAHRVAAEMTGS